MEQATTWWQILVIILGAMGGLEGVKWLFNRKTDTRLAIAQAESAEFHTLQETNEFLQKQLQAKEERFVEQTERLRKTQDDLFKAKNAEYEARLELARTKCVDQDCPYRKPPNANTPPKPGVSRDEWHEARADKNPPTQTPTPS